MYQREPGRPRGRGKIGCPAHIIELRDSTGLVSQTSGLTASAESSHLALLYSGFIQLCFYLGRKCFPSTDHALGHAWWPLAKLQPPVTKRDIQILEYLYILPSKILLKRYHFLTLFKKDYSIAKNSNEENMGEGCRHP